MKKFIFIAIACVCLTACGEKTAEAAKNVGKATADLATTAASEAAEATKDAATEAAADLAAKETRGFGTV